MPANTENDELVMTLVAKTLEHKPAEREAYLRGACAESTALFDTIWQRVRWEERMGSFLKAPLFSQQDLDSSFQPGDVLARRFRVIRQVAHGGMGVVYEAIDQKLDRRVAIKCALPGYGGRLPPEARNAREVSHPNVCKIHDIHTFRTERGEIDFLSMEYLEGETVTERIQRDRRIAESEVREVARQLLTGLDAAHSKGVVHGDLKSNNIVLCNKPDGGLRVVITDFGLARPVVNATGDGAPLSSASMRAGAPEYMAPELLRGDPPSIAADLYAFGVVLHELVVGSRPAAPGRVAHGLPIHWKRVIARCLQLEPRKRFASAQQVLRSIAGRRPRWVWAALLLPFLLLLIPQVRQAIGEWFTSPPVRLAVLPFEAEPEMRPLASGLLQDVSNRLTHSGGKLLVIPVTDTERENVRTVEQGKSMFNATHVLRGGMRKNGSKLAISAALVEVESGTVVRPFSAEYQPSELALVAKAITGSVAAGLHLREPARAETVWPDAYQFYVRGVYYLRRDSESGDQAIPLFDKAIELDPSSPLPYAGLAEAQLQNYRRKKGKKWLELAQASTSKAEARNPDSVPVRLVAGLLKQTLGSYGKAADDFIRAIELDPKSGEGYRRLADLYRSQDKTGDALATYRKAIQVEPSYYRPYLDLAGFNYLQAQYRGAETQYREVVKIAPEYPAGHNGLGLALMEMGRYEEAEKELRAALRVRESPYYFNSLGALFAYLGRDTEAAAYYQRAIEKGAPSSIVHINLGDSQRRLSQVAESQSSYRKARDMSETDVLEDPQQVLARSSLAYACARLGDTRRGEMEIVQAVKFRPNDAMVQKLAVLTYEALNKREESLDILASVSSELLSALSRHPDLAGLRQDPRFVEMLTKTPEK
jgi:eukaryotic-like serine/threonine-protein kinase